ncbi:MAG TPA: alpha/beta hydrolase [Burkholderiales bacterium]|nr:alpha/beta hydrolase [Burkholderiales bacterium]
MRTELVSITTPTAPLAGLYYEPDGGATAGAVVYFHGTTMNFYVCAAQFLPPVLTKLGFSFLAFNRRGHDTLGTRNSRLAEGGAFETTAQALEDNRLAASWLAQRGFPRPVVIGHSYGGMLGVRHVADHPETPALVLLSAGRGGPRQAHASGTERLFAVDRFDELKARAEELVRSGRGKELMLLPGWWYAISAESFLDRIANVPDTIALAPRINCPVLAIRGGKEDVDRYPAEEFQRVAGGPCQVEIVPDCDHFYNGREEAICELVSSWLARALRLPKAA